MAGELRYYSVEEAARVLRLTPERVLEMLEGGELEGVRTGGPGDWRVPLHGGPTVSPAPLEAPPIPPPLTGGQDSPGEPPELPAPAHAEHRELTEAQSGPEPPAAALEAPRKAPESPRGHASATTPEPTSESGWVTTQQAARALGISARTVRWHIERGNLAAIPEGEGVERTWRVSVDSLHAFRDARQRQRQSPGNYRTSHASAEIAPEVRGNAIRELADRLVEEARRAEEARVRLELAERAQSTLEAELADERRRRTEAERERDELRRRLESREEPSKAPPPRSEAPAPPRQSAGPQQAAQRPSAPPPEAPSRRRSWWRRVLRG